MFSVDMFYELLEGIEKHSQYLVRDLNLRDIQTWEEDMPRLNLQTVLTRSPLGLAFDIDGTLSPIALTPDEAVLHPEVPSLLEHARRKVYIAIITGRSIVNGADLVNIRGLTYVGTHGLEWCDGLPSENVVKIVPEALAYIEAGKYLLDLAEKELTALHGLVVERKLIGGSLHYRRCPDPSQAQQLIFSLLEQPALQLDMRLIRGRQVVEVKTPLAINKGYALRQFVEQNALQSIVFAGDDSTDLDAVLEVSRLRQEGIAALSIVVRHSDTMPELLERADIVVYGVEGMVKLLRILVAKL